MIKCKTFSGSLLPIRASISCQPWRHTARALDRYKTAGSWLLFRSARNSRRFAWLLTENPSGLTKVPSRGDNKASHCWNSIFARSIYTSSTGLVLYRFILKRFYARFNLTFLYYWSNDRDSCRCYSLFQKEKRTAASKGSKRPLQILRFRKERDYV